MYCNRCGSNNPDGSRFCNSCGAPFAYPNQMHSNGRSNPSQNLPNNQQATPRFDAYMQQNLESGPISKKAAKKRANAAKSVKTPPRNHFKSSKPGPASGVGPGATAGPVSGDGSSKAGFKLILGIIVVAALSVIIIAIASINVFSSLNGADQQNVDSVGTADKWGGISEGDGSTDDSASLFDWLYSDALSGGYAGHFAGAINPDAITEEERQSTFEDASKLGGFESKEALANFTANQFKRMFTVEAGVIYSENAIQDLYAQAPPYAIKVLTGGSDASINELLKLTLENMGYDNAYMLANLQGVDTQAKASITYTLSAFDIQSINNTFKLCELGYEVSAGYYIGIDLTMQSSVDTGTFKAGVPQYFNMSNTGFYAIQIDDRWFIWNTVLS